MGMLLLHCAAHHSLSVFKCNNGLARKSHAKPFMFKINTLINANILTMVSLTLHVVFAHLLNQGGATHTEHVCRSRHNSPLRF